MENKNELKQRLLAETNGFCVYCGHKVNEQTMEIEHIIPKARGGEDSYGNYVCACHKCNAAKADKMPQVFLAEMRQRKQEAFRNRLAGLQKGQRISAEKVILLTEGRPEAASTSSENTDILKRILSCLEKKESAPKAVDAELGGDSFTMEVGRIAGRPIVLRISFSVEMGVKEDEGISDFGTRLFGRAASRFVDEEDTKGALFEDFFSVK